MVVSKFLKFREETSKSPVLFAPMHLCIPTDPRRDRSGTEYLADVGRERETASRLSVTSVSPENRTVRPHNISNIKTVDASRSQAPYECINDVSYAYRGDPCAYNRICPAGIFFFRYFHQYFNKQAGPLNEVYSSGQRI